MAKKYQETRYSLRHLSKIQASTQEIRDTTSKPVAVKFDQTYLCRYPRPLRCVHDNGKEFVGKEFQELLSSYGIQSTPTICTPSTQEYDSL